MRKNITIDFKPTTTYKDWIFADKKENELDFFSKKQIEELVDKSLEKIPERLLSVLEILNWKILISNTRNLEAECGATSKIYGYTHFEKKEIVVYATEKGITESLPHEMAHFLDLLINISNTPQWDKVYKEEKEKFELMKFIFTSINYKTECFADAFLAYIIVNSDLKRYSPKTYKIIENIFKYINYILDDDCLEKYKNIEKEKAEKLIKSLTEVSCFSDGYNYL